ncbi:hypothetical protein G9A89_007676 [Geosiphon pyriformis]|nr:hypothetical protein G9A89_007676 [Geosiphon pyriformis]
MAYTSIAKLKKFTGEKDNTQIWLNNIEKAITLPNLKHSKNLNNNNSINHLANIFTTIKQGENKAVTIYLGHFYRNLCQIQVIQADYFTTPQILNQFIRGLCSSILQYICPIHPADLQATVTNARDFELAKLEANHAQAVNLVINGLSELDSKLKQYSNSINQKLEGTISTELLIYDTTANLSTTSLLTDNIHNLSTAVPVYLSAAVSSNLSISTNSNTVTKLTLKQNPKAETDLTELKIVNGIPRPSYQDLNNGIRAPDTPKTQMPNKDISPNNRKSKQKQPLISNIPPATIFNDKFLAAIFFFELKETVKVNDQLGHRVDCAASACIITTDGATKTSIGKIDDLPIEPIKYHGLIKTTTNYHQYSLGMMTEKEHKRKNLPGMPTKPGKLTMAQTNCQPGNEKKPTKGKEKEKKKTYPKKPPP